MEIAHNVSLKPVHCRDLICAWEAYWFASSFSVAREVVRVAVQNSIPWAHYWSCLFEATTNKYWKCKMDNVVRGSVQRLVSHTHAGSMQVRRRNGVEAHLSYLLRLCTFIILTPSSYKQWHMRTIMNRRRYIVARDILKSEEIWSW